MRELIKKLKLEIIMSALLALVLGVVFVVYPVESVITISRVISGIIIFFGIIQIVIALSYGRFTHFSVLVGVVFIAIGAWMFLFPEKVVGLIPLLMGLLMIAHGIVGFRYMAMAIQSGYSKWWIMLLLSAISIIFGVICALNAFEIVEFAMMLVGFGLIYDGIVDIWIVIRASFAARSFKKSLETTIKDHNAVDVEAHVVDEEE